MTRAERRVLAQIENSAVAWEVCEMARDFRQACERDGERQYCQSWVTKYTPKGDFMEFEYSRFFTASILLKELQAQATPNNREKLPKSANHLGRELHKISAGLKMKNVQLSYKRHRSERLWELKVVVTKTL